ncbi:glycoside hydrolase superfamily [Chytridium lagenaria]|nr:glycoside hydrolase superfamily [Chytridium lagenaria]
MVPYGVGISSLSIVMAVWAFLNARTLYDLPSPEYLIVSVDPISNQFIDKYGRSRLFRGLNVVYKQPPWHPELDSFHPSRSFSREDAEIFEELNLNTIRLGVHWAGVEPVRGQYNTTYLETMRRLVEIAAERGIYVIIEFHQDVLASQFCGHGVPDWFVKKEWQPGWRQFPFPLRFWPFTTEADGIPSQKDCDSITWYLVYSNHDGLLDSFLKYWQLVVKTFMAYENVIGYEIINEPWPGNHWKDPMLLFPNMGATSTLYRFQQQVASAIRSIDPDSIIFFTGATWDPDWGVTEVPGGKQYANRSVSAFHYYSPPSMSSPLKAMERRAQGELLRLKVGIFMTEFEMWDDVKNFEKSVRKRWATLSAADVWLQSWTGWSYKSFAQDAGGTDGCLFDETGTGEAKPHVEKMLGRTYADAVAGQILNMSFNETTAQFNLEFLSETEIEALTSVRLNRRLYYNDGCWLSWQDRGGSTIDFSYTASAEPHKPITIMVHRRPII